MIRLLSFLLLPAFLSAEVSVDESVAVTRAREHLVSIGYPGAATVALDVEPDPGSSIKIRVGKNLPSGWWAAHREAIIYAAKRDGAILRSLYRFDTDGVDLPDPAAIFGGLCSPGSAKDEDRMRATRAIELMQRWFEVHRNEEATDFTVAYGRLEAAYAAAGREGELMAALAKEQAAATGTAARYAIVNLRARILGDAGDRAGAEALWREASDLMAGQVGLLDDERSSRIAEPIMEIARMYERACDPARALATYADWFATPTARANPYTLLLFGYCDLLLKAQRSTEAVVLCEAWLAAQESREWSSPDLKQRSLAKVQALLNRAKRANQP